MIGRIVLIFLLLGLFVASAFSQTLTVAPLPRDTLSRSAFLTEGYSGSVALVAGDINDSAQAENADDLRLLRSETCYPLVDFPRSRTGRLYFAISQATTNTTYRNAFLAAQVIRFVPSQTGSDVAVSRNTGPWVAPRGRPRPLSGADWNFLGKTAQQFADAHALSAGNFQGAKVDAFFAKTKDGNNVQWHARLPRKISARRIDGYYSSLDPALAPVWTGLMNEFGAVPQENYRRLIRSYLISLDFGARSGRPVVFATDPLDADYVIVRIQSAPGSNFPTHHTFAFGLTSSGCGFLGHSSGGVFSWFR